jgi:hypothetical protein
MPFDQSREGQLGAIAVASSESFEKLSISKPAHGAFAE